MRLLSMSLLLSCGCAPQPEFGCGTSARPCKVDLGRYVVRLPVDWDRQTPIPAYVYFHGYGGSADGMLASGRHQEGVDEHQVIGIYPDGLQRTWSHQGSPSDRRDDQAFVEQVLADASPRFPIDAERVAIGGFSQGASMAWHMACYRPELASMFVPVSGTFWMPFPDDCVAAPLKLHHEHGTADPTFPMEGRAIGVSHQGDTRLAFDAMAALHDCSPPSETTWTHGTCQVWSTCGSGAELSLCLHDGGHAVRSGWHDRTWARMP